MQNFVFFGVQFQARNLKPTKILTCVLRLSARYSSHEIKKVKLLYSHDVHVHSFDGRRPGTAYAPHAIIDSHVAKCGHAAKTLAVGERHYDFITGEFTGNWLGSIVSEPTTLAMTSTVRTQALTSSSVSLWGTG